MFDEFLGLPLHVFIIHATLAILPGAATLALAYVVLGSWRWLLRWPLVLTALGAPVVTFVTVQAGKALKDDLGLPDELIATHEERGELLFILVLVFAVVALVAAFTMGGPSLLASGAGARRGSARALQVGVGVLLVVAAVLVLVLVILTGDAGSRAVWEGRI
ncbi:MAG: hypothetical protein M3211_07740 [Actinomycetota bacterium]|nr:hypothetical protein [Actinomycetota bacterium]